MRIQVNGTRPLRKHLAKIYTHSCKLTCPHVLLKLCPERSVLASLDGLFEQYLAYLSYTARDLFPPTQMSGSATVEVWSNPAWWRIISCLKAELVFAENPCHLIDDQHCVLLCHGGPGSSTSLQGVRLSPTLQYNILFVRVYSMLQTFYLKSQFTSAILKYMSCWALPLHFLVI